MKSLRFKVIEVAKDTPGSSKKRPKGFGFSEFYYQVLFVMGDSTCENRGRLCQEFSLRAPFGTQPKQETLKAEVTRKMKFSYDLMASDSRLESSIELELPPVTVTELEGLLEEMELS
jgi:hypothetical protein